MRYAIIRSLLLLVLFSGCDSSWRTRIPIGTKLYEGTNHQYFGKVIGYENQHDFSNGTDPCPAILIEPADPGREKVWGSCATCAASFDMQAP